MIKRMIPVAILIAFSVNAIAQQFEEKTSINIPSCSRFKFVDINNDGLLDIVLFSAYDGDNVFYFNGVDYSSSLLMTLRSYIIWFDFADTYNNGHMIGYSTFAIDLSMCDYVELFYNVGSYSSTDWDIGSEYRSKYFSYDDFDNDGILDLFTSSESQDWVEIVNLDFSLNSEGISPISESQILHQFEITTDVDNNGILDILTDSGLYERQGNGYSAIWNNNITSSAWGDYDSDGMMDLLAVYNDSIIIVNNSGIYDFNFFYVGGFPDKRYISAKWGDYDNDGDIDILAEDEKTIPMYETSVKIFENKGGNIFEISDSLYLFDYYYPQFTDFDSDGDLDIAAVREDATVIFENTIEIPNSAPDAPTNLSAQIHNDTVILSWNKALDDHTNSLSLTYNIKLGTTSGGIEFTSPHSLANGTRLIEEKGNQLLDTFAIYILPAGTYYWSIQAIDNCFKGSEFSEEGSFTIIVNDVEKQEYLTDFSFEQDLLSENITITFNENEFCSGCNITIADINGRVKESLPINSESIRISTMGWAKGIYFCTLTDNGNLLKTMKFAIQ